MKIIMGRDSGAWQQKLLPLMRDDRRALQTHHRPYSMVAYAWGNRYQQSNQRVIQTMAAAMLPAGATRSRAQAWLVAQDYQQAKLRLDALARLGGRMSSANIAFDDHPNEKRYAGRIETVTADSVFRWLERSGLGGKAQPVTLPGWRTRSGAKGLAELTHWPGLTHRMTGFCPSSPKPDPAIP